MTDQHSNPQPSRFQFSLSALMWLIATIGMVLAYLRTFEGGGEAWLGIVAVGVGLLVGVFGAAGCALVRHFLGVRAADNPVLGIQTQATFVDRLADAVFWSIMGAMSTFICAAGYDLYHPSFRFGWILVGAVAGAATGISAPGRPLRSILVGCLGGGAVLGAFLLVLSKFEPESLLEVAVAAIGGGLLGGVVEAIYWAEARGRVKRYVTTAGLMFAVIAGNLAAKFLIPGW